MSDDILISQHANSAHSDGGRFDRRQLIARSAAVGAGLATASALTHIGARALAQDATPAASANATADIISAAIAFVGTLSDSEQQTGLFDWSDTAQKQRWSNFPPAGFQRAGLRWGDLSQGSQEAWLAVMQATLSKEGYDRVRAEWAADDALLAQQGDGGGFGMDNYYIALIGTPSESDPWQWQWGGHHVTVNATLQGDNMSLNPSFIGVQPATYTDANGNTVRPLGDIEDEAFALIDSLDDDQKSIAILGDTYVDLVLGPGQDGKTLQPEGLPAAQLTDDQRSALAHLISHYTGLGYDAHSAARQAEVEADLDSTYLAWYGDTTEGQPAYFRVTGPKIVIEYSPQSMGGNAADHIHGIYRDPTNDYGAAFTGITLTS